MKELVLKYFARLVLISEPLVKISDRVDYFKAILVRLAPVAFVLETIQWWFSDNKQFGQFMCIALFINMVIGIWFHVSNKSFTWEDFFLKNGRMTAIVIVVYVMLEMLRYTAGDNIAGELFKITIQLTTLLWPTSKVFKNVYILSGGEFPPEFIMNKLYNFEKNGDLKAFFESNKKEDR